MLLVWDGRIYKKMTWKILLRLTLLRVYKSNLIIRFQKKVAGGLFDAYGIVLKEKKNDEDLFWSNF